MVQDSAESELESDLMAAEASHITLRAQQVKILWHKTLKILQTEKDMMKYTSGIVEQLMKQNDQLRALHNRQVGEMAEWAHIMATLSSRIKATKQFKKKEVCKPMDEVIALIKQQIIDAKNTLQEVQPLE